MRWLALGLIGCTAENNLTELKILWITQEW